MDTKPTLRLFADYACSIPLWEDGEEYGYGEILDGSQEQLAEMGGFKNNSCPYGVSLLRF